VQILAYWSEASFRGLEGSLNPEGKKGRKGREERGGREF